MHRITRCIIFSLLSAIIIVGCNSTPDEVLPKEKMAQLLADIHIGESLVDVERTKFYNDSLKKVVKQSILAKHGVTQEQLDTSFSWYGHHIEEYIAVYDRVIEILEEDISQLGTDNQKSNISFEGDSVNTWTGKQHYDFSPMSPSQYITFNLPKDHHWANGDYYTWRIKLINNRIQLKWGIAADYSDGSSEFVNSIIYNEGWNEIKLITDSTKSLNRVYGYIYASPKKQEKIFIDSISLTRMRYDKNMYRQRFGQKTFDLSAKKESEPENKDSLSSEQNTKKTIPIIESKQTSQPKKPETKNNDDSNSQFKKLKLYGN